MKGGIDELSCFTRTAEDIIYRFPRNVNPFCDIYRCCDVIEDQEILKKLTEVTQIFTTEEEMNF